MLRFIIPGYYLFHSRLKRKSEVISLFVLYPFFLFLIIGSQLNYDIFYFLTFTISLITWLSFYEIGYMENDTLTIQKEKSPTLRIPENEILLIRNNFQLLQILRTFVGLILLGILYYIEENSVYNLNFLPFAGFIILARLSYLIHNNIRNRWNIATYFVLSISKYLSLTSLFLSGDTFIFIAAIIFFAFPLIRTIENSSSKKYHITWVKNMVGKLDLFRVKYYGFLLIISTILFFVLEKEGYLLLSTLVFLLFFLFRLSALIFVKMGKYKRTNLESQNWKS